MFGAAGQILRQIWLARAATATARHQAGLAVVQCERWASGLAAINDRELRRLWAGAPGGLRSAEGEEQASRAKNEAAARSSVEATWTSDGR